MCGHSVSLHFRNGAERWEAERWWRLFHSIDALFSSTQKIQRDAGAKIPALHQGKIEATNPQQFSSCPADAQPGVRGENPRKGREPLRADKAVSSWKLFLVENKQIQEQRSRPVIVICCRPCKTPTLLTTSLTSKNLSRTTSLLFQLHCVFVSLFFFSFLSPAYSLLPQGFLLSGSFGF